MKTKISLASYKLQWQHGMLKVIMPFPFARVVQWRFIHPVYVNLGYWFSVMQQCSNLVRSNLKHNPAEEPWLYVAGIVHPCLEKFILVWLNVGCAMRRDLKPLV